ncbi:MAG: CPBP family intramembrane metalloprotease [Fuerstiella sp.]|nr:CPBP family intramembrane metalloprotease [Fuerstiella sp.]MCP4505931.1 CPBP family intramembrane metalloprotease [Fuerstiella sp.]
MIGDSSRRSAGRSAVVCPNQLYRIFVTNDLPPRQTLTLSQFLIGAGLFEGALLLVAFALGLVVDVHPTAELDWSLQDFGIGLSATVPMLFLLVACLLSKANGLVQIREFLREMLGPLLDRCRIIDILFLALLAGVCEEVLFRGLLYQWIRPWNPTLAIMVCNLLFALAHSITPLYAMLAGFIGLYLTALMTVDSTPNLLIPMTAHVAYDFVAFLVILWDYRRTVASG